MVGNNEITSETVQRHFARILASGRSCAALGHKFSTKTASLLPWTTNYHIFPLVLNLIYGLLAPTLSGAGRMDGNAVIFGKENAEKSDDNPAAARTEIGKQKMSSTR